MQAGATEVIPETMESSLMLASHLLHVLDVPMSQDPAQRSRKCVPTATACCAACSAARTPCPSNTSHAFREQLHTVTLDAGTYAMQQRP